MRRYASNALTSAGTYGIGQFAEVSTCSFEELLNSCDIDLDTIAQTGFNIAEGAFKKLIGPFGKALNGMFAIAKYTDVTAQTISIAYSGDNPYITIYATTDNYSEVTVHDVTVEADEDTIESDSVLQVFKVTYEKVMPLRNGQEPPDGEFEVYNIRFVKDGEETQPAGTVTVRIPITDWYDRESCAVYRQEDDGGWTKLDSSVTNDGILIFQTDHFSLYALLSESALSAVIHSAEIRQVTTMSNDAYIVTQIYCPKNEDATAYCAYYDNDGRLIEVRTNDLLSGTDNLLTFPIDDYATFGSASILVALVRKWVGGSFQPLKSVL